MKNYNYPDDYIINQQFNLIKESLEIISTRMLDMESPEKFSKAFKTVDCILHEMIENYIIKRVINNDSEDDNC